MSLRCPPMIEIASGSRGVGQQWCLDPVWAGSTGDGPVKSALTARRLPSTSAALQSISTRRYQQSLCGVLMPFFRGGSSTARPSIRVRPEDAGDARAPFLTRTNRMACVRHSPRALLLGWPLSARSLPMTGVHAQRRLQREARPRSNRDVSRGNWRPTLRAACSTKLRGSATSTNGVLQRSSCSRHASRVEGCLVDCPGGADFDDRHRCQAERR
jgi:hypothetical protein